MIKFDGYYVYRTCVCGDVSVFADGLPWAIGKYTNAITLCLACRTEVESYISLFERCEHKKGEVCVSDVTVMI